MDRAGRGISIAPEDVRVVFVQLQATELAIGGKLSQSGQFDKTPPVGARHHYVDVVIPGYEALVTYCTKGGATRSIVGKVVLIADMNDLCQHGQQAFLNGRHGERCTTGGFARAPRSPRQC